MIKLATLVRAALLILLVISSLTYPAHRVLWDTSHRPFGDNDLDGNYSQLAQTLRQNGYTVSQSDIPVHRQGLWNVDILVISVLSNYNSAYTAAEVDRIFSFVSAGGGLIVLADNTQSRPENIRPALNQFGLYIAQSDGMGEITVFNDHPICEGIEQVDFLEGGEVDVDEDEGGEIIGFDRWDYGGIAVNDSFGGSIVVFGDADFLTNDGLAEADNQTIALNSFAHADREVHGYFQSQLGRRTAYMLPGETDTLQFTVENTGDGPLEVALQFHREVDWIEATPQYSVLQAGENLDVSIILNTIGVEPDQDLSMELGVFHNGINAEPFSIDYNLHVLPVEPVRFVAPGPTGQDHSLLITEITFEGAAIRTGFEIGVFTPGQICAGSKVFTELPLGIPVRSDDRLTQEVEGFVPGERMTFWFYLPWDDVIVEAVPEFTRGDEVYTNNGLSVLTLDGSPFIDQQITLANRWNLISLNVSPFLHDFQSILAPLIEDEMLVMVKDGRGRFWRLDHGFNNLRNWDLTQGYEIRVAQPTDFVVRGSIIPNEFPVRVSIGWNLISYIPQQPLALEPAVASLEDNLIILKRDDGAFYLPEWDWNGIGILEPGEGYRVKMCSVDTLIYPEPEDVQDAALISKPDFSCLPTGSDMSILLINSEQFDKIRAVDESENVYGQTTLMGADRVGFPIWGDDPNTGEVDGFIESEKFRIEFHSGNNWHDLPIEWLSGSSDYQTDGLSVGRIIEAVNTLPEEISVESYPNPFNDRLNLKFQSKNVSEYSISIFDVSGRLIDSWKGDSKQKGGSGLISFSSKNWRAGVLFVQVSNRTETKILKVVHLP